MAQLFGNFIDESPASHEYLILGFSPSSIPLKQRWRNNGLSADFLADYLTTFFPASDSDPSTLRRQADIKSAVSYIANELLENAMKFNDESSDYPISIQLQLHHDRIIFYVTNSVSTLTVEHFQAFIKNIINTDPQELYIRQLEENVNNDVQANSGVGLLTMINDYMAILGWKFETISDNSKIITVTTMVQLTI